MAIGDVCSRGLTIRTQSEEFQPVGYVGEAVFPGDTLLENFGKAFTDFHHGGAFAANKVMMVAIVILPEQFKARCAVAKIEALHHCHFFKQTQRSINRGEIAIELPVDLARCERMIFAAQHFQNQLTRPGNSLRVLAEARGQIGKVLPWMSVRGH